MLTLDPETLPEDSERLRKRVRAFIDEHRHGWRQPNSDFSSGHDPEFSALLGKRGWIGMTWPKAYGGAEASFFDRYVVTEELLAAGAPVSAHWIADRQSGPLMLRYGTDQQKAKYLPGIAAGRSYFSIGMSEPNTGSDLASVRTSAKPVDGGWVVNGTKLWSTDAHRNHYMVALVRTDPNPDNRHAGLSQFVIHLRDDDVDIRPIRNIAGSEDFNEVVFSDTFLPEDRLVGELGHGWEQVTSELSYERSGPERFLSAFRVLVELIRHCQEYPDTVNDAQRTVGRLVAHLVTLRRMSISVAGMLENGKSPSVEAALVKELGNNYEKLVPELARLVVDTAPSDSRFRRTFIDTLLITPAFTIRGGTREILRGVIARGLGLR